MRGTITAYSPRKHWGFVTDTNGGDHFFHDDNTPGFKPELGLVVEFEIIAPFKLGLRPQAANLRKVESQGGVS